MKKNTLSKRAAAYMKRIEACTDRNEIEGIRIEFSQPPERTAGQADPNPRRSLRRYEHGYYLL